MAIVAFLGNSVNEYIGNYLTLLAGMEFFCEKHPEQRLAHHGTYMRTVKDAEVQIPIQRFICNKCKRAKLGGTVSVLPDFLEPRKQFTRAEVASVIAQYRAGKRLLEIDSKASFSTIRRWLRESSTQDEQISLGKGRIITTVPPENPARGSRAPSPPYHRRVMLERLAPGAISITACC